MIKVYQIQLTDEEVELVNTVGWEATPRTKAYLAKMFDFNPDNFQYYDHVANVMTDDREDAFRLMNLWEDESLIERIGPSQSSMSVGDIVEMETGERYLCDSFGFKEI